MLTSIQVNTELIHMMEYVEYTSTNNRKDLWVRIKQLAWDTTANNTVHEGAAKHFEVCIKHGILWCPCRRHKCELHIKHAYEALFGKTVGKDNQFFKRFKEWWLAEAQANNGFPDPASFKQWRWPRPTSQKNRNLIAWANEVLQ